MWERLGGLPLTALLLSACTAQIGDAAGQSAATGVAAGQSAATGGRSGRTGQGIDARPASGQPAPVGPMPAVAISEIMYSPVLENAAEDEHEFIEIHNPGTKVVPLRGWALGGQVKFTFAADASLAPGQYLVVAKNRAKLLALAAYRLAATDVVGDYTGSLDNGTGTVTLANDGGTLIDSARYSSRFPWPLGADALGASADHLSAPNLPLAKHQYLGRSLERISFDVPATDVANWAPSPLDGATPGRANSTAGDPQAIVMAVSAKVPGGTDETTPNGATGAIIRATDAVQITVTFSERGSVNQPEVEYFVDDVEKTDEPHLKVALIQSADQTTWTVTLPAQADRSVVRFRINGDRGAGPETVSPRPSDPYPFHAYFVSPNITPGNANNFVYHAFVPLKAWGQMWDNIKDRALLGGTCMGNCTCKMNPTWDNTISLTFVADGVVYDVRARYGGSPYNRFSGPLIPVWTGKAPSGPLLALSWRFKFPRYHRLQGKRGGVYLNKLAQACPGVNWFVEAALMNQEKIPSVDIRFGRFYVNGTYYHYMMDKDVVDADLLKKRLSKDQATGDLYKASGATWINDEGPYAPADGRVIKDFCGWKVAERVDLTYSLQTNGWKGTGDMVNLLAAMEKARAGGIEAMKQFLQNTFDLDELLTYVAIRNWSAPWDEVVHNYFLYRLPTGKWWMMPDDYDGEVGAFGASGLTTFFTGQLGGTAITATSLVNHFKDTLFKAYRAEYVQKLHDLDKSTLSPTAVLPLVDQGMKLINMSDWMASPAYKDTCDVNKAVTGMRQFIIDRHTAVGALK